MVNNALVHKATLLFVSTISLDEISTPYPLTTKLSLRQPFK